MCGRQEQVKKWKRSQASEREKSVRKQVSERRRAHSAGARLPAPESQAASEADGRQQPRESVNSETTSKLSSFSFLSFPLINRATVKSECQHSCMLQNRPPNWTQTREATFCSRSHAGVLRDFAFSSIARSRKLRARHTMFSPATCVRATTGHGKALTITSFAEARGSQVGDEVFLHLSLDSSYASLVFSLKVLFHEVGDLEVRRLPLVNVLAVTRTQDSSVSGTRSHRLGTYLVRIKLKAGSETKSELMSERLMRMMTGIICRTTP